MTGQAQPTGATDTIVIWGTVTDAQETGDKFSTGTVGGNAVRIMAGGALYSRARAAIVQAHLIFFSEAATVAVKKCPFARDTYFRFIVVDSGPKGGGKCYADNVIVAQIGTKHKQSKIRDHRVGCTVAQSAS